MSPALPPTPDPTPVPTLVLPARPPDAVLLPEVELPLLDPPEPAFPDVPAGGGVMPAVSPPHAWAHQTGNASKRTVQWDFDM
jgi:hypothetical protein